MENFDNKTSRKNSASLRQRSPESKIDSDTQASRDAGPFLKWAGSKRFLATEIVRRLPAQIDTYYEPFVGGGAIFFALATKKRFKRAVLCDTNKELIRTYRAIRDSVEGVIQALKNRNYEETEYYAARDLDPNDLTDTMCAARFIYLNRTCFNGLYRVNKAGRFNVPFGRYTNPTICNADNLRAASVTLKNVSLSASDFSEEMDEAGKGDAVYADPPYWPVSDTANFTSYTKDGFSSDDQARLCSAAFRAGDRGVYVLLSNADVPPVRRLYREFHMTEVQAPRRVNSSGAKRGNVGELLISTEAP